MKEWLKILFLCSFFCGCASTYNYEKHLELFVGLPLSHLESYLGKPQGIELLPDGRTVVEYRTYRVADYYVDQPYTQEYMGPDIIPPEDYIQKPDEYRKALWCRTKFFISPGGIVDSWTIEGNDCTK
jgi:hypothetical protein